MNTQGTNLAGDVKLTSQGNIRVNLIQTGNTLISEDSLVGSQGDIEINAQRNIVIGSINSQSDGNGAIVNISSETGTINITGGIDLGSGSGTGGKINLTAQRDIFLSGVFFVDTGTLDAGKVNIFSRTGNIEGENSALRAAATTEFGLTGSVLGNGGIITVQALQDITLGEISTFSENFEGGDVEITSTNGSIELALINTQGNTRGGDVTLDAQNGFIRLTNTFLNSNGNNTSISTTSSVAGNGGSVTIRHGGQGIVPFVVGDGTGEIVTNNGTLGLIDTGNSIIPPDSYPFTQEVGNIRVISIDNVPEKNITDEVQRNSDPTTTDADSLTLLTPSSTIPTANLESAKEILTSIAENTGIKPAIVYVDFAPTGVSQTSLENREAKLNAQYQEELSGISPDKGINVNPPPAPTDKLQLVLITEEGERVPITVPITREEILAEANKLYQEVAELGQNYLEPAKKLYKWLFAPIEAELEAQGIQNVLYIMPEGLRLVPLAALYDENSNQYLAQKYSAGYSPSLSLTDTRYKDIKDAQVLAFGASTFEAEEDQNELPAVKIEIPLIAGEILPGKFFLDQEFTQEKLLAARQENPFPIIHLATHADFQQEDNSQTYIQLYDNKLSYDQLRSLNLSNPPVELMVISACRSAFGDREAELGFGGLAAQLGVKTVVASLWYVGDTGTLALMSEFYRELKQAPIKAEALRQAQIAMITGEVKKESDKIISLRGGTTRSINLPSESAAVEEDLSHPFYWAAFTMIGSPW
ncbi:MAG: CHAT domain-containing protein [Cyanobacteria bacterium J083]|nr:MAG: CHAT domain-containing protein [Cyanobacteria bacterium J083]